MMDKGHNFKGGSKVNAVRQNQLIGGNVVGLKELRDNISTVFESAINNFQEVLIGNTKKGGNTASIISTWLLTELLESYKFNPLVKFDEDTKQYEITIDEINATGSGISKEDAIEVTLDNVLALTEDFFDEIELYMRMEAYKKHYPYFMRIKHCKNKEELAKVLDLI